MSIKGELFADQNRMHFIIIPRKFNDQKPKKTKNYFPKEQRVGKSCFY